MISGIGVVYCSCGVAPLRFHASMPVILLKRMTEGRNVGVILPGVVAGAICSSFSWMSTTKREIKDNTCGKVSRKQELNRCFRLVVHLSSKSYGNVSKS